MLDEHLINIKVDRTHLDVVVFLGYDDLVGSSINGLVLLEEHNALHLHHDIVLFGGQQNRRDNQLGLSFVLEKLDLGEVQREERMVPFITLFSHLLVKLANVFAFDRVEVGGLHVKAFLQQDLVILGLVHFHPDAVLHVNRYGYIRAVGHLAQELIAVVQVEVHFGALDFLVA
jgi:hypothetical protein